MKCYSCKTELDINPRLKMNKDEECPKCRQDLRCCKMCDFFDPKIYNECRETSAERVVDKQKKNFCDYFILTTQEQRAADANSVLDAAKSLFKN
jgi:hypothetical protein